MDNINDKQREMLKRVCKGFTAEVIVSVLINIYGYAKVFDTVAYSMEDRDETDERQGIKQKG